jgi:hypothetical protein
MMFEHSKLDGERIRVLTSSEGYTSSEILETRESAAGKAIAEIGRLQFAVVDETLVQRFLPPEGFGDVWSFDSAAVPWWEVVSHPPHAGVVADFNKAFGGQYRRELAKDNNVVAYAGSGEPVVMDGEQYHMSKDGVELTGANLKVLRDSYYAVG